MKCDDNISILKGSKVVLTEPPIFRTLPDKIIQKNIESRERVILQKFPAHTKTVGRAIKVVSDAFVKVWNYESLEGFIWSGIKSPSRNFLFDSKKDHIVNLINKISYLLVLVIFLSFQCQINTVFGGHCFFFLWNFRLYITFFCNNLYLIRVGTWRYCASILKLCKNFQNDNIYGLNSTVTQTS